VGMSRCRVGCGAGAHPDGFGSPDDRNDICQDEGEAGLWETHMISAAPNVAASIGPGPGLRTCGRSAMNRSANGRAG
jgi:hypothetical protein